MKTRLVGVSKIADSAPHNAFTSLARFADQWVCAFREGSSHVSEDGAIRILRSRDGCQWESAALITAHDPTRPDLRDPKLLVIPSGELALIAAGTNRGTEIPRSSYLYLSVNGTDWSTPGLAGKNGCWLWSLTSEGNTLYSAGYERLPEEGHGKVTLYHCSDSHSDHFKQLTTLYTDARFPNETALLFHEGRGIAVIRRELAPGQTAVPPYNCGTALLATSEAPYTHWETTDLGLYIGGPALLRLPGGELLVCGRKIVNTVHYTALWQLHPDTRTLEELRILPSAGDCSYPGMVWHNDRLRISYYSQHEGKTAIYFAELELHP